MSPFTRKQKREFIENLKNVVSVEIVLTLDEAVSKSNDANYNYIATTKRTFDRAVSDLKQKIDNFQVLIITGHGNDYEIGSEHGGHNILADFTVDELASKLDVFKSKTLIINACGEDFNFGIEMKKKGFNEVYCSSGALYNNGSYIENIDNLTLYPM